MLIDCVLACFAKNNTLLLSCVDLAKQIIHSCMTARSCFSCLINASYMEAYTCSYMLLNASYTCPIYYQMMIPVWEQGYLSLWMCVIPPPCFGKVVLCWLSSFVCQPFFALSCPQPDGFLPALLALWCLPRYSQQCRKPGTSFLRPSQDVCIAWKFSICQLCFLTGLIR